MKRGVGVQHDCTYDWSMTSSASRVMMIYERCYHTIANPLGAVLGDEAYSRSVRH